MCDKFCENIRNAISLILEHTSSLSLYPHKLIGPCYGGEHLRIKCFKKRVVNSPNEQGGLK
jgi:hypothetical protein